MIINLSDGWRITSDANNWILQYKPEPKPGMKRKHEKWRSKGFFRNLANCVDYCLEQRLRMLDVETGGDILQTLNARWDRWDADLEAIKNDPRVWK